MRPESLKHRQRIIDDIDLMGQASWGTQVWLDIDIRGPNLPKNILVPKKNF